METDFPEYKLSCELRGHDDDVRGICVCDIAGIATSSRDRTVRFWPADASGKYKGGSSSKILLGHTSFVCPLAWIPPSEEFPEGGLVSGGMDMMVLVWDLRTGEKVQTLRGHKQQVSGLVLDDGDIVSSSVDCTLKRWRNGKSIESWEAHSAAVQAVVKLPSGELVTGSTDTTLKLWRGKTCVHTFTGHTDTVRGLAVMPDFGILSSSHDGSIRLWALTGEVLMEMVGHTSIVYSVDSHASGLVVSGSEDCSAKIWKDGACVQSIDHPGCVWDAKFFVNGDLVTACSDGVIRVWTTHEDRIADPVELESYFSVLSAYKGSRKTVGGLKLEDLPGLEALKTPGTSDGQTKIVREGDNGVAYAWNAREYKWDKIGEVVDGPNDGLKRPVLDGVEYDCVFDVDIGDGEPIRKLPYNQSDNPYSAADKWLLNQNLPLSYRQQIVDFILENTGQKSFNFDSSFRDPFTGSSAYIPGETSNRNSMPSKPAFKHIPKRGMLVFDVAQFDGILKKMSEFNSALHSDPEQKQLSLSDLEVARLSAVVKILKDTSHYHSSSFADVDVDLLLKLVNVWSLSMIFPVIDMLRMMVLHPDGADKLVKHVDGNGTLVVMIKKVTASPAILANILTSLRLLVNLFKDSRFHQWLLHNRTEILDAFSSCSTSSNKNVQLAHSTLIVNYSVLLIEKKDEEGQSQVLFAALEIAELENIDLDSKFRALVAIGSLALQQQQQFEREVAIGEIEYSRNVLLNKLQQYTGTEHFDVIKEATALASSIKVLQHNNDDNDLLLLPPYPNPTHAAPSHSLIIFDNTNPRLSRNPPTQDDFNKIDQTGRHASSSSPLDSLKWFMIAAAKVILPVVGVVAVLSLPGYQPRHMTEKMIGSQCPPGKVAVIEGGKVRCIVKERVEIPFTSVASNADATYGCG